MAVEATQTPSVAAEGVGISNHVLSIPHAQFPTFLTQVVRLSPSGSSSASSSLFLWCGSIPPSLARKTLDSKSVEAAEPGNEELEAALAAAGRSAEESEAVAPGLLAQEFAVAMASRTAASGAVGTALFSTPADLAAPMARRIATKLGIAQLFLSLDLPHPLMPTPGQPQRAEDSKALLALERALREVCAAVLHTPASSTQTTLTS